MQRKDPAQVSKPRLAPRKQPSGLMHLTNRKSLVQQIIFSTMPVALLYRCESKMCQLVPFLQTARKFSTNIYVSPEECTDFDDPPPLTFTLAPPAG